MTRRIFLSSSIKLVLVCSRPAVSMITTSTPRAFAAEIPSKTTEDGSEPSFPRTSSAPLRSAQIASCSVAAARNVSAATNITRLPCDDNSRPSFPIVVVFPLPFTPTTSTTAGFPRSASPPPGSVKNSRTSSLKRATA